MKLHHFCAITACIVFTGLISCSNQSTMNTHPQSILRASKHTSAPLAVHKSVTIKAPAERIWKTVEDHRAYATWMPMVKDIEVFHEDESEAGDDVGTVREFKFGPDKIQETMLEVQPNRLLAYHAADTLMFKEHLAAVEIIPQQDGDNYVSYSVYFVPQNLKGRLMRRMILPMMLKKSLKNLKALSEQ